MYEIIVLLEDRLINGPAKCCFRVHKLLKNEPFVHLHINNLAAQTGVTRFTQIHDHWTYSKNETLQPDEYQQFTHMLVEAKSKYSSNLKAFSHTHVVLDNVDSFSHVTVSYKFIPPIRIKTKPALFILERKDFREFPRGHSIQTIDTANSEDSESRQASAEETVVNVVTYENVDAVVEESAIVDENIVSDHYDNDVEEDDLEKEIIVEDTTAPKVTIVTDDDTDTLTEEDKLQTEDQETQTEVPTPDLPKAKKAFDELKASRKERKKKAIAKIKSETRKEVVASAKEKLKEIMKRHKHIAEELSENIIASVEEMKEDSRGDIPDTEISEVESPVEEVQLEQDDAIDLSETINRTNENIDAIVEEVIVRLIDRKMYDDKTKPEDIKAEDRQMIQKIVEEVLLEKMNYSNPDGKIIINI